MFYLVRPNGEVFWTSIPEDLMDSSRKAKPDLDMDALDWEHSTELPVGFPDLVKIGLRSGHSTSTGLAIPSSVASELGRADELKRLNAQSEERQAQLAPQNQFMDRLFPGWLERGKERDLRIAATAAELIDEAQANAERLLGAEPIPTLVEHWQSLGGRIPG